MHLNLAGQGEKLSPVRAAGVSGDTRNYTTAHAFPGGGRFAWLPGTAANARVPDHFASLSGGKVLLEHHSTLLPPGSGVEFDADASGH